MTSTRGLHSGHRTGSIPPAPRRRLAAGLRTVVLAAMSALLVAGAALPGAATSAASTPAVSAPAAPAALVRTGEVAADATRAYVLNRVRTNDGRAMTVRWNPCQPQVTYQVNPARAAGTVAGRAAAVRDVHTAFRLLSAASGIRFVSRGLTSSIPTGSTWAAKNSAEIVVAWVDQGRAVTRSSLLGRFTNGDAAGTGGYAYRYWSSGNGWRGVIGRGYVVLDARQNSGFRAGFGAGVTRGNLLLHELGHVVGLQHTSDRNQLMYPVLLGRARSGYRPGDLAGLRALGRSSGCVSSLAQGWPDL